jgi:hypothetical protein
VGTVHKIAGCIQGWEHSVQITKGEEVNGSKLGEDFVDPTVNVLVTEASVKSNAAEKGLKRGIMVRFKGGDKGLKNRQGRAMKDGSPNMQSSSLMQGRTLRKS